MAEQSSKFTINNYPVVIANPENYPDAQGRANGYVCPLGPMAGRCWLLVSRGVLNAINTESSVAVGIATSGDNAQFVVLPNMRFVKALSASGGVPSQNEAVYLVELADVRNVLKWAPVNSQYNVRSADTYDGADATTAYYSETLNGSSLWTWATLCEDLWGKLPAIAGAFPGLPYSPHGNPEGFKFIGVSAWNALNGILEKIDCAVAYDPVADTFAIVRTGATQAGLSLVESRYVYLDDAAPIESISAKMAETVRVYFHKQRVNYATEIETPRIGNVSQDMVHFEDVATGQSAVAGTVHIIWDDLPALIEFDGTITNATALTDRANEVAENWIGEQMMSRSRKLYSGLASEFRCGSEVKAFAWRDYGEGLVTEVVKHPGLPRGYGDDFDLQWPEQENLASPDLARHSFPLFPKLMQVVKITGASGTNISPSTGLWPAKIQCWSVQDSSWHDGENVWLKITNHTPPSTLIGGDRYPSRLSGSINNDGDVRPLYMAHSPSVSTGIVWAKSLSLWHNASGNGSYVDCHLVTDKDGGTEVLDGDGNPIEVRVYLPRPNKMVDPNVRGEKTIAAEIDANGIYVCVSDYLDDAIGTVKMWIGNDTDVAEGWRIYSTAEGKFPVGVTSSDPDIPATAPGVTGGRKKHKHPDDGDATVWNTDPAIVVIADHPATLTGPVTLSITGYGGRQLPLQSFILYGNGYVETEAVEMSITGGGVVDTSATKCNAGAGIVIANHAAGVTGDGGAGSGTASGTTASNTTGISVAEHGTHAHNISSSGRNDADLGAGIEGVIQSVSATTAANASGTNVTQHSVTDPGHTHTFSSISVTIGAHNHTTPALSHSVTEAPHLHTVEVAQIAARLSLNPNPHAHEVSVSRIAEQMVGTGFVTLPGYEPVITPNPHYHTIYAMTHESLPHYHHIPDTPLSKHIPPFFGIYFIERFE